MARKVHVFSDGHRREFQGSLMGRLRGRLEESRSGSQGEDRDRVVLSVPDLLPTSPQFLDDRACEAGCSLTKDEKWQVSRWKAAISQFNEGTLSGGPGECKAVACTGAIESPLPTPFQTMIPTPQAYIRLE